MNLGFVGANSFARMMNRVRMNSHLHATRSAGGMSGDVRFFPFPLLPSPFSEV